MDLRAPRAAAATVTITNAALDRLEVTPLTTSLPIGMYAATGVFSDGLVVLQ